MKRMTFIITDFKGVSKENFEGDLGSSSWSLREHGTCFNALELSLTQKYLLLILLTFSFSAHLSVLVEAATVAPPPGTVIQSRVQVSPGASLL